MGHLKALAKDLGVANNFSGTEIIKKIIQTNPNDKIVDKFIRDGYWQKVRARKNLISDENLMQELLKVKSFSWGVVQGQLDQKIQSEYVRRIARYDELLKSVKANLHDEVTNYVICTWFNHWTTVLIEEHISTHPRVIPTIKPVKGIDIFFDGQPFDLKVTYPREYISKYGIDKALIDNQHLAIWMYENQGAQRFGSDNRLFVVLVDKENPDKSWELKRNFDLVFKKIDNFFDKVAVSKKDEIVFTFAKKTYTAVSKALIITK
ncbi:MAG: hypothetical protein L0Z48_05920 [candidate division Zixibacteria bacterium]|nr:hypothetical protein [candidate division Zixibacteria bacterium]